MEYLYNIGYDFDGVLCESMPAFHRHWKEKYGFDMFDLGHPTFEMPMPEDYDLKDIHEDIVEALNTYQLYLHPHSYAMEMVREFAKEFNETPIIITARSKKVTRSTNEWLKMCLGIPYTLVHVEGHGNKADVIASYKVKHYVEDRFRTCNQINSCEKVFMPDRAWNWDRTPQDHVVRVHDLVDVWDHIKTDE